jgi:hypothetical protein
MARLECGSGERSEDSLLVDDCVVFLIDVALPAGRDVGLVGVRRVQGFEADEFMLCGDDSGGGRRVASIEVDVGVKATHGEGALLLVSLAGVVLGQVVPAFGAWRESRKPCEHRDDWGAAGRFHDLRWWRLFGGLVLGTVGACLHSLASLSDEPVVRRSVRAAGRAEAGRRPGGGRSLNFGQ